MPIVMMRLFSGVQGDGCAARHGLMLSFKLGKWVKPLHGAIRSWMVGVNRLDLWPALHQDQDNAV